jgi:hypothetical protein
MHRTLARRAAVAALNQPCVPSDTRTMKIGNLIASAAVIVWSGGVLLLAALGHNGFSGDGAYGMGQVVGFAFMGLLFVVGARGIRTELRRRRR